ncbi:MAG: DUF4136 domain-containing protein [Myxococcota bacterium]
MPNLRSWASLCVLWLAAAGCAAIQVRTDYDAEFDFSALQRFAWRSPERTPEAQDDPLGDSTLIEKHVYRAVVSALAAKGFAEAPATRADFLVRYGVDNERKYASLPASPYPLLFPYPYPYYPTFGFGHYHGFYAYDGQPILRGPIQPPGTLADVNADAPLAYVESHLILDILAPGGSEILWRGWARQLGHSSRWSAEEIGVAVRRILARFPPGRAKG